MSSDQTALVATSPTEFALPSTDLQLVKSTKPTPALPVNDVPWQTNQKLNKHFKPWPGLLHACNWAAKVGAIGFLPVEARATAYYVVDDITDHVYKTPRTLKEAASTVLSELKIPLPIRQGRKRKTASCFAHTQNDMLCAPCEIDDFIPKKLETLTL